MKPEGRRTLESTLVISLSLSDRSLSTLEQLRQVTEAATLDDVIHAALREYAQRHQIFVPDRRNFSRGLPDRIARPTPPPGMHALVVQINNVNRWMTALTDRLGKNARDVLIEALNDYDLKHRK